MSITDDGGIVKGKLHSECDEDGCGVDFTIIGTNQEVEMERDEAVIVPEAFEDECFRDSFCSNPKKYKMTGSTSQIASAINALGGGTNWDPGAKVWKNGRKMSVPRKIGRKFKKPFFVEGGSVVINRTNMLDPKEHTFEGTAYEIASKINSHNGNGVKLLDNNGNKMQFGGLARFMNRFTGVLDNQMHQEDIQRWFNDWKQGKLLDTDGNLVTNQWKVETAIREKLINKYGSSPYFMAGGDVGKINSYGGNGVKLVDSQGNKLNKGGEIIDSELSYEDVSTGTPVTFHYLHTKTNTPNFGSRFGQDIEPHGKYIVSVGKNAYRLEDTERETFEYGTVNFKNPLVVTFDDESGLAWKKQLSEEHKKKGKALSKHLIKLGYDGIIPRNKRTGYIMEMVDLRDFKKTGGEIEEENRGGNCYLVAGKFAIDKVNRIGGQEFIGEPYLVHAQVHGQGALLGVAYGHAFIEDDYFVYDFSNNNEFIVPKDVYYTIGKITKKQPYYFKYTFDEAIKKMVESGTYGSWDLKTESGL